MLDLFNQVVKNFTNEWLILIEMYELAQQLSHKTLSEKIIRHLEHIKQNFPKNRQSVKYCDCDTLATFLETDNQSNIVIVIHWQLS